MCRQINKITNAGKDARNNSTDNRVSSLKVGLQNTNFMCIFEYSVCSRVHNKTQKLSIRRYVIYEGVRGKLDKLSRIVFLEKTVSKL